MENKFVEEAAKQNEPIQDEEGWKRLEGVVASQLQAVAAFWDRLGHMAEEEALVNAPSTLAPVLKSAAEKLRNEAAQAREDADLDATASEDERALTGKVSRITRLAGLAGKEFEQAMHHELRETGKTLLAWQGRMASRLPSASRLQEGLATIRTSVTQQESLLS